MKDKTKLLLILILSSVMSQAFSQNSFFEINNRTTDTLTISIYTENPSREILSEQIVIVKQKSEFKVYIKSNLALNIDTSFTLNNLQIDRIKSYQLSVINGTIQTNFKTLHRLALIHKIENTDLSITRQTYAGQEYSLGYLLIRTE